MEPEVDLLQDLQPAQRGALMSRKWKVGLILFSIFLGVYAIITVNHAFELVYKSTAPAISFQATLGIVFLVVIAMPLVAAILASMISLLPVKGYAYSKKFWPISLFILFLLQFILAVMSNFSTPQSTAVDSLHQLP